VYEAQTGLTQWYGCQQLSHVWGNCKQPPHCMWYGGGHLNKECLEKGNTASILTCCNCKLVDGEEPHPSNCRGCRHAKEEVRKRKSQRAPKTTTGRVFSSSHTTPGLSFKFHKISSPIRKLIRRDTQTHRQHDDSISLLLFFQNIESRQKIWE
jgi:hypothetical protein